MAMAIESIQAPPRFGELERLRALDPDQASSLLAGEFRRRGYRVRHGAPAGGEAEFFLTRGKERVILSAGQWRSLTTDVPAVQAAAWDQFRRHASGCVVATCGSFTAEARDYGRTTGLTLLDGLAILHLVERFG